MKIREGFVSNSSSSSFMIMGVETDISNLNINLLKNNKIVVVGKELNEGTDIFEIKTLDEIALVRAIQRLNIFYFRIFVDTYDHITYGGECLSMDNCSSHDYEDILEKYSMEWGDPEKSERVKKQIETEKQVFLRSEKIKKIENEKV